MIRATSAILRLVVVSCLTTSAEAAAPSSTKPAKTESVEALVKRTMQSVVVIRGTGRDGRQDGLGSGFVIDADGLIATNLHVVGEGRSFIVETADGRKLQPTAVFASDRNLDLAVVRVEAEGLPALELGDSEDVAPGREIVALGNPQGLEHSVVTGVVSGSREIDGLPLLQLAIPIEPGNSGGPVLDRSGRVLGIVTMKSQVTDNLGFAVKINALKPLIDKPNTVLMANWLTIGAIDARRWEPLFGAKWRQRAGRIVVEGSGSGFGGRSLCLAKQNPPKDSYELAVSVKLDDESGAAGLIFAADGEQRHYGFYPSAGKLRLSRFDGPDVYSWSVLDERPSDAYRPGDWNRLKVHVEADRVQCYVNGAKVFEHELNDPPGNRLGLAKFRATAAEFKQFEAAKQIAEPTASPQLLKEVEQLTSRLPKTGSAAPALIDGLSGDSRAAADLLRGRADRLQHEAEQLRLLAGVLHRRRTIDDLARLLEKSDEEIDLLRAAFAIAKLDNEEVDVDAYVEEVERMAAEVRAKLPKKADDDAKLAALNKYMFEENGFHGSRRDYYNRSNSYLNEVIDDREGLPITLSVLYLEIGRRIGLPLAGIGLPGHFVVGVLDDDDEVREYRDPFEQGAVLTEDDAVALVEEAAGRKPTDEQLGPVTKRAIVLRMLENLLGVASSREQRPRMAGYLDAILVVSPEHMERRMMRAMLHYETGRLDEALADVDYLLEHHRDQLDEERVLELRDRLEREKREK